MRQKETGKVILKRASTVLLGGYLLNSVQPAEASQKHFTPILNGLHRQASGMSRHELRMMQRSNPAVSANGQFRNQSMQLNAAGNLVRLNSGINLDLDSQVRNITLGQNLFDSGNSVTIAEGGETRTLTAGSQVSAAEYIAAKQVLSGGEQKILLDHSGRANGGEVDLNAITADNDRMRAANLVVASNVTTYGDFSKRSDFRLLGDLDNFGTVHALSGDAKVRGGTIGAHDINNHAGALISSDVGLTLDASGRLNNEGTISADGTLSIIAADGINNRGALQSRNGDINLNAPQTLTVNNARGTISAVNGAINVRSADYTRTYDSTITGGDLISRELNLNSGQGLVSVAVNELTGVLNGTGNAAHVLCSTDTMNIGSVCLTGDPTFYNSTGNINITGAGISAAENLVIAASGNITSDANVTIEAGNTLQGFSITLIAGAEITPVSGKDSPTLPGGTAGAISLSGKASKTGGSILLGTNNKILAQANPLGVGTQDAGDVNLWAFASKTPGTGVIDVSDTFISAKGNAKGFNGIVQMTAGAQNTDAIKTGGIDITGGVVPGGLFLGTAQPTTSNKKQPINYDAFGAQSGSSLVASTKKSKDANIVFTSGGGGVVDLGLSIPGAEPSFIAGGEIFINQAKIQADTTFGDLVFEAGADIRMAAGTPAIKAAAVSFFADGNIGSAANHVAIDAVSASAGAEGSAVFVDVAGAGDVTFVALHAQDEVHVSAPGRKFSTKAGFDITAKSTLTVDAFDLGPFSYGFIKDTVSFKTGNAAGQPLNGNYGGSKNLTLDIAAGVGTLANPVDIEFCTNVNLLGPSVFAQNTGSKVYTVQVTAKSDSKVTGPMILGDSNVSAGVLTAEANGKTLTVDGKIFASDGINITNLGKSASSKIVFAVDADVQTKAAPTKGAINISVGPAGVPADNGGPFPGINIIENGGQVIVNGPGIKTNTKGKVNTLQAEGVNLTINNGFKESNILLDGNVLIKADPPVPEGTPVYVTEALTVQTGQPGSGTGSGAQQLLTLERALNIPVSSPVVSIENGIDPSVAILDSSVKSDSVMNLVTANNAGSLGPSSLMMSASDDSYMMVSQPNRLEHDASICSEDYEKASRNGSTLFVPTKDIAFTTDAGTIKIAAGSVVLVSVGRSHLSIYDLHDDAKNAVTIESGGKTMSLAPGRHVSIATKRIDSFASMNAIEAVPHRGMLRQEIGERTVFQSEFSILSAAKVVKPLRAILSSQHGRRQCSPTGELNNKKIAQKLMKTAAVLLTLSNNGVPYEFHVKPSLVALNK